MADNPNKGRITDESWRFMQELLAMEPGTENSGIYANKPGYHGTLEENEARDAKDGDSDYSREHPLDLLGPRDKAAAYDWTHGAAQSGDYRSMAKYGNRLKAAFDARDPRLNGWAEAQGQTDLDATPEELNFGPAWTKGTPSSSHAWHWHLSERRAYVGSWVNKECMLSILRGESLAAYLARGGQLVSSGEGENMATPKEVWDVKISAISEGYTAPAGEYLKWLITITRQASRIETLLMLVAGKVDGIDADELAQIKEAARTGAEAGLLSGADELAAAVAEHLAEHTSLTPEQAEAAASAAVRKLLGSLDGATPAAS